MRLAEQWNAIESRLDPRWIAAQLELRVPDETQRNRASTLLGPAGPGRAGTSIRFAGTRDGTGVGPEAVRRMLRRIDAAGIAGTLMLVSALDAPAERAVSPSSLATEWDGAVAVLPADWSDLLCELELTSSDHLDRAALLLAPLNPIQLDSSQAAGRRLGFQFRCARTFGYGVSAGMARRCLARLDEQSIPGCVRVLRALTDTHPVGTQGPVWYVGGKAV
jgi:hypothetical protein